MKIHLLFSALLISGLLAAQPDEDLIRLMDSLSGYDTRQLVIATFKSSHLVNHHTSEVPGRRTLDVRIAHRFGTFDRGSYNAWGLDGPMNIRLSADYSPAGRWMIGIGRSSLQKMVDMTFKFKLLRQTAKEEMPISMTIVSTAFYTPEHIPDENGYTAFPYGWDRFSYCHMVIAARKFSDRFSCQVQGIYLHYNLARRIADRNDVFATGLAARFKLTTRFSVLAEHCFTLNNYTFSEHTNASGFGFELETGGHVFQFFATNAFGIVENQFVSQTTSELSIQSFRFGFNLSRVITI